jgi:hypothetical protein
MVTAGSFSFRESGVMLGGEGRRRGAAVGRRAGSHRPALAGRELRGWRVAHPTPQKQLADPDAVAIAEAHVQFCGPPEILALAQDVVEAWREIRTSAMNLEGADAQSVIRQRFADRRILPSAVRERIADRAVAG